MNTSTAYQHSKFPHSNSDHFPTAMYIILKMRIVVVCGREVFTVGQAMHWRTLSAWAVETCSLCQPYCVQR
jgi:hypothetical protein